MHTYIIYIVECSFVYFTVITVMFSQSVYYVKENSGSLQAALVLSNPLSAPVIVQVTDSVGSNDGE